MKYAVAMILCFTVIVACAESRAEPQKYATLENLATDKVKLEIKDTRWTPLVGPSGFGGNKESLFYPDRVDDCGGHHRYFGGCGVAGLSGLHGSCACH